MDGWTYKQNLIIKSFAFEKHPLIFDFILQVYEHGISYTVVIENLYNLIQILNISTYMPDSMSVCLFHTQILWCAVGVERGALEVSTPPYSPPNEFEHPWLIAVYNTG